MSGSLPRHVLLDRDGVLAVERDGVTVTRARDWEWIEGAVEALRRLLTAGCRVGCATNQSVIGRGLTTTEEIDVLHRTVFDALEGGVDALDFILYCPHAPEEGCACRKPQPGMLRTAAQRWGIDAGEIVFVGDAMSDLLASRAAGLGFALVRTGKGEETEAALRRAGGLAKLWGGRGYADLAEVVDELLRDAEVQHRSGPG